MKKLMPVFILTLLTGNCALTQTPALSTVKDSLETGGQYLVLSERPNEKSLVGIISREALTSDTSFHWYANSLKGYTPNSEAITGLKKNADSIQLLTFMGTWCEDSHYIIPKLFTLLDSAGFSASRFTLIGVNREKKTLSHLAEALGITNVPTIIVLKKGKEMGRVVEYGKTGMFDKDLTEIFKLL